MPKKHAQKCILSDENDERENEKAYKNVKIHKNVMKIP